MDIKDFIPRGKENAISREMLRTLTGCSDREVRKMIREARLNHEGSFILSSSDVSGYWLSENLSEVRAFLLETYNRAENTNAVVRVYKQELAIRESAAERRRKHPAYHVKEWRAKGRYS